jgi:hypothetical protein
MDKAIADANIGQLVYRTDGTPKPPKHHTKKVRAWEESNYTGILVDVIVYPEGIFANVKYKVIGSYVSPTAVFHRSGIRIENLHFGEHPEAPADDSIR